jgi:hypothetical protein
MPRFISPPRFHTIYLLLAFCASLLEIGPPIHALVLGHGLQTVLWIGLAYQLGNGASSLFAPSAQRVIAAASIGVVLAAFQGSLAIHACSIALLSVALQWSRKAVKNAATSLPGTVTKRAARVLGFVAVAVAAPAHGLLVALVACAASILAAREDNHARPAIARAALPTVPFFHSIGVVMMLHQLHYFVYSYVVIWLVHSGAPFGKLITCCLFALGWVTYLCAEPLYRGMHPRRVFLFGHTFVALCLLGIAILHSTPVIPDVLWVMTGFGGGSVYCISKMGRSRGLGEAQLEHWEDIGHVGGVAAALLLGYLFSFSAPIFFVAGAAFALAAIVVYLIRPDLAGHKHTTEG